MEGKFLAAIFLGVKVKIGQLFGVLLRNAKKGRILAYPGSYYHHSDRSISNPYFYHKKRPIVDDYGTSFDLSDQRYTRMHMLKSGTLDNITQVTVMTRQRQRRRRRASRSDRSWRRRTDRARHARTGA